MRNKCVTNHVLLRNETYYFLKRVPYDFVETRTIQGALLQSLDAQNTYVLLLLNFKLRLTLQ